MSAPPHPTLADTADLPPTLSVAHAARLLGISRTTGYTLAAAGRFPTPVLRIGHGYRVPTAPLLTLLGLTPTPSREDPPPADEEPS